MVGPDVLMSLTMMFASFGAGLFMVLNAIHAIRSPAEFLRARWTIRRGFTVDTPLKSVRFLGGLLIVGASIWLLIGYNLLMNIIQAWSAK